MHSLNKLEKRELIRGVLFAVGISTLLSLIFLASANQVFEQATVDFPLAREQGLFRLTENIGPYLLLFILLSVVLFVLLFRRVFATLFELQSLLESYRANDLTAQYSGDTRDDIGKVGRALSQSARQAILAKEESLKKQAKQKAIFAHIVHDLRTPLATIDAALQSLNDDRFLEDSESLSQFVRSIEQAMDAYKVLGDSLPSLRGATDPEIFLQACPIVTIARGVVARHQPLARRGNISLSLDTAESEIETLSNSQLFDRILSNLLTNAIQYTPEGGRVSLFLETSSSHLCCRVSDSGSGISADDQERIFEASYRGRNAKEGGAGLGLSFVKDATHRLGGEVSVESSDQGSVFTLTFPMRSMLGPEINDQKDSGLPKSQELIEKSKKGEDTEGVSPPWLWAFGLAFLLTIAPNRYLHPALLPVQAAVGLLCFLWSFRRVRSFEVVTAVSLLSGFVAFALYQQGCFSLVFWSALFGAFLVDSFFRVDSRFSRLLVVSISLVATFIWLRSTDHIELCILFFGGGVLTQSLCRKVLWAAGERKLLLTFVVSFGICLLSLSSFLVFLLSEEILSSLGPVPSEVESEVRRVIVRAEFPLAIGTLLAILATSATIYLRGRRILDTFFRELSEMARFLESGEYPILNRQFSNPLLEMFSRLAEETASDLRMIERTEQEIQQTVEATSQGISRFLRKSDEIVAALRLSLPSGSNVLPAVSLARGFISGEQLLISSLFTFLRLETTSSRYEKTDSFSLDECVASALMTLGLFAKSLNIRLLQDLKSGESLVIGSERLSDALVIAALQGTIVAAGECGLIKVGSRVEDDRLMLVAEVQSIDDEMNDLPLGFFVARALSKTVGWEVAFQQNSSNHLQIEIIASS